MSFDTLQEKIREKKNPTVAGLDPRLEFIPPHILNASLKEYGETLMGAADAVWEFSKGLSLTPFLETCKALDKCAFVLAKTSNPSSVELQDMVAGDRLVYKVMGDLTERLAKGTAGKYGYDALGVVVGATHPNELKDLRKRLAHSFFLVPGYGAQGGTAEDVQYAFDRYGHGAIVNASRSIMCAWTKTGKDGADYQEAAAAAAITMRDEIGRYVTIV